VKLIALETSTRRLSVVLWLDGKFIERTEDIPNGGSERLLPWVNEMLAEAGMPIRDLDGIAFGAGPGGFTGLRLACGVAQGLAFGLDLPVLGVSSLEAMALAAYRGSAGTEHLFACVDARMGEVYCAAYRIHGEVSETLMAPVVRAPQAVSIQSLPDGRAWIGCGEGFLSYPELLAIDWAEVRSDCWPTAAAVARLAAPRLAGGEGVTAGMAVPLYVRDKVALTTAERLARGGLN
jgi:tRNA threonylcarbamoyladenosine biosynthesis protein TsaB